MRKGVGADPLHSIGVAKRRDKRVDARATAAAKLETVKRQAL